MELSIAKLRAPLMALRALPARGLWPYTPDPAEPGLHVLGEPGGDSPLLLEGNSRHALSRLRRAFGPAACRVLLLDTGGVDLYTAHAVGTLTLEMVLEALPALRSGAQDELLDPAPAAEEDGFAPIPLLGTHALISYPLWHALDGERLAAAGVQPGPAHPEDLPAYLLGAPLRPGAQQRGAPLRERLHAAAAHAFPLLFVAALPLMVVGWEALLLAVGMAAVATFANVLVLPQLARRLAIVALWWLPAALLALLLGVLVVLGSAAGGLAPVQALLVGSAMAIVSTWLGICCGRLPDCALARGR